MKYIAGTLRYQLNLFETKLDDINTEDNPVRFIDEFLAFLS